MKTFKFESLAGFEAAIKEPTPTFSTLIYQAIKKSYENGEKSSKLFNIILNSEQVECEITLPKKQWAKALRSCLNDFETYEESDLAIDCYLLRKKISK